MSSGFVSGGTAGHETERDAEWKAAAQQLEDARREKEKLAEQHDGKSLFEILQANKEKKQAEFEEKARFKLHNALDDEEADYLDSVLEKQRKEEANVKKETSEQLEIFRMQQEEAERKALEEESAELPTENGGLWVARGRKRKKGSEVSLLKGVKLRKSTSATEETETFESKKGSTQNAVATRPMTTIEKSASNNSKPPPATGPIQPSMASPPSKSSNTLLPGLGYASSDED